MAARHTPGQDDEQLVMAFMMPDQNSPFSEPPRQASFEDLAHENGSVFWWASDLAKLLGYADLKSFKKAVQRAMTVCVQLDVNITDNFVQVRDATGDNFKLSRFACYLAAMNGDVTKPAVAQAQAYFVTYARACEVYVTEAEGVDRVIVRSEIADSEKGLARAAKASGVIDYASFQNAGYRGLYNRSIGQLRALKKLPERRSPLDFMGPRELAANLFRLQETDARLRAHLVRGQAPAEATATEVGREIRDVMTRDGGEPPEALPPAEDIRTVQRGIKATGRGLTKIDQPRAPKKLPPKK